MLSSALVGDGRVLLAALLQDYPATNGLFCSADSLALGALIGARAQDIDMPGQLRNFG